jgi:SOS-response transcriptional repressor LexA/DNA-binding CsgD family transcriptional regulator
VSTELKPIKPSHIAAARLKVAIANKTGKDVPTWIRQLADQDLTAATSSRAPSDPLTDQDAPVSSAFKPIEGAGASQPASNKPDSDVRSVKPIGARFPNVQLVPVLETVAAGQPALAAEEVTEYLPVPPQHAQRQDVFALKVHGDSMSGDGVLDGDYVIVIPDPEPEDGDMVVALIGGESIIRRLRHEGAAVHLESSNPTNPTLILEQDTEPVILGKVIGTTRWSSRQRRASKEVPHLSDANVELLTPREMQVLRLLVEGQPTSEIASELVVSVTTVRAHLAHIFRKLGVSNRREAVARSSELGLRSHD